LAKESVACQLAHRVLWKKACEGASPARRKLLIRKQQRDRVPEKGTDATIAGSGNKIHPAWGIMEGTPMSMRDKIVALWCDEQGQDIAEYAVMLAVILVIVVGTIRLIGSNANNVFSSVASSIN
jgi:Flp pilus assembly pilin Flp